MKLSVQHLTKAFGSEPVIRDLSFGLADGETLGVLGRSGGGKTTLLKLIAGLLPPDAGTVHLNGRDITHLPPQARRVVYLYQEPLLFPHLTVFENVAFGLRLRKENETTLRQQTDAMLESLGLGGQGRKLPHQLSGGQKQRASFGRALVIRPELVLLDEPFGNLDVETRSAMQRLYKELARVHGISAVFVTHDLKEAMLMGDRLAYLEGGQLRVFENLRAFITDPAVGVGPEIAFWQRLNETGDIRQKT
jgi:putrescine transport system ATP-binding protein